ncbi:serine/threonine-protein kinase [Peristeroidobacter agariperforans]|uniref:serine/threonine-protein kinase n=1 Tax=Peristeroidobacter agariperforans TaxID=268404 RepID=UPI00101C117A|nr:serine/threonine-protein kinase [Peristeroidobacter agariperforans]
MLKPYKRAEVSFELRKNIGHEGKNSEVHLAYDPNLDAEIVIKRVLKSELDVPAYFSESQLLYKSGHPNVVPILYASEDADCIYLAMPYFRRGSLNAALSKRFLTVREVIRYATHFLAGLHNVHSKGLVHFDVKPDNILLTDRDEAVLSDFGLAKQLNLNGVAEQDRSYFKMQPPEFFNDQEFDARFDIYQVGVTLYRLINGNSMFYDQFGTYGDQANFDFQQFRFDVINERFPDRAHHLEHVPARLRNVIKKCLKSDRSERYKSSTDVVSDLASIGGADLDWRYEPGMDGCRQWTKVQADREIRLRVDGTMQSHAEKRCGDGPFRRIKAFCMDSISDQEIRQFLRTDGNEETN